MDNFRMKSFVESLAFVIVSGFLLHANVSAESPVQNEAHPGAAATFDVPLYRSSKGQDLVANQYKEQLPEQEQTSAGGYFYLPPVDHSSLYYSRQHAAGAGEGVLQEQQPHHRHPENINVFDEEPATQRSPQPLDQSHFKEYLPPLKGEQQQQQQSVGHEHVGNGQKEIFQQYQDQGIVQNHRLQEHQGQLQHQHQQFQPQQQQKLSESTSSKGPSYLPPRLGAAEPSDLRNAFVHVDSTSSQKQAESLSTAQDFIHLPTGYEFQKPDEAAAKEAFLQLHSLQLEQKKQQKLQEQQQQLLQQDDLRSFTSDTTSGQQQAQYDDFLQPAAATQTDFSNPLSEAATQTNTNNNADQYQAQQEPQQLKIRSSKIRTVQILIPKTTKTVKVLETADAAGVTTLRILGHSNEKQPSDGHQSVRWAAASESSSSHNGHNQSLQSMKIFKGHKGTNNGTWRRPSAGVGGALHKQYLPPRHNGRNYKRHQRF